jgi:hypothetical protein
MNNWIPQKRILKIAITTASVGVVLYFAFLFVVIHKINIIETSYRGTESESFKEEKFWAIKSIIEINKDKIQNLDNFFIKKGDEVKFIEQIEEVARQSSIKFNIASIDVANQNEQFKENVKVKVNIEGSWKNAVSFVNDLEKMPFGVSIENMVLDAKTPSDWSGFVEFIVFREK